MEQASDIKPEVIAKSDCGSAFSARQPVMHFTGLFVQLVLC